ncbi:MAG: hypothetical protein WD061_00735 [Candidatus Saccharimonadales bacterium]
MWKKVTSLFLSVGFVAAALTAAYNQQAIADWWFLRNYEPDPEIATLAEESYLDGHGQELFYLSDPKINSKSEFNINCPVIEQAFVLGCYHDKNIYVLEIDRDELHGVMQVTAAHEMLHAAYERLNASERQQITSQLEDFYTTIDNEKLSGLLDRYEKSGGLAIRQNEMHSIIPTQIVDLPNELEEYFSQYFSDRQALVQLYEKYESVFIELNEEIAAMQTDLESYRAQLENLDTQIRNERANIDRLNAELAQREANGDLSGYNVLVPEQNAAVARHNNMIDTYQDIVELHNQLVIKINDLVLTQNKLVNAMDSTYESL